MKMRSDACLLSSGSTLLEFMVATSFFLILLLAGYEGLHRQIELSRFAVKTTRPETESNYRILILRHFLENLSQKFAADPSLECATYFFPYQDWKPGNPEYGFFVALMTDSVMPFQSNNGVIDVPQDLESPVGTYCALAGADESGQYCWNYGRVTQQPSKRSLRLEMVLSNPTPITGTIGIVQMHGFAFRDHTLYWISPSGQWQPFLENLTSFEYSWNRPQLSIRWSVGGIKADFGMTL